MHLFADLGGEYSTNDEDHRWIVKQCAEQWEMDRARLDSARELLKRVRMKSAVGQPISAELHFKIDALLAEDEEE